LQQPVTISFELPQAALDELAAAWSQLDRCRPARSSGVPAAHRVARRWARSALAVDGLLMSVLSGTYAGIRAEEDGGPQVAALRWVWLLVEAGHGMSSVLSASAGPDRLFWELYWRPIEELRQAPAGVPGRDEYVLHLASRPVRQPASATTAFLLSVARYRAK
jgi:hypothetical protein